MTPLGSIPEHIKNDTYQILPRALNVSQVINALMQDESSRLEMGSIDGQAITDILDEYKEQLSALDPQDLYDLAYESVVLNDTFDATIGAVWVDRSGRFQVTPRDLDRYLFIEIIAELVAKHGYSDLADSSDVNRQLEKILAEGKGSIKLKDDGKITFSKIGLSVSVSAKRSLTDFDLNSAEHHYKLARANIGSIPESSFEFSSRF